MGHCWRAVLRFFAMFTAMWPLTSSSLAIDVLLFDIRDFEVRSPLVTRASCSTTAIAAAQHARMLASAKICKWTAPISPTNEAILLGTLTSLSCFVHLKHWFFNLGELLHSNLSSLRRLLDKYAFPQPWWARLSRMGHRQFLGN